MKDPINAMANARRQHVGGLPAEHMDTRSVRDALDVAPVTDAQRTAVEAILERRDLTRRDCYDLRMVLSGLTSARDRLNEQIIAFSSEAQAALFGRGS